MTAAMQLLTAVGLYCLLMSHVLCATDDVWYKWKQLHGKKYSGELEEKARKRQFEINLNIIAEHNLKHDVGLVSYTMRMNRFSDLSLEEFKQLYLCKLTTDVPHASENIVESALTAAEIDAAPSEVDWRTKGLVTDIKDQSSCGSCWAFSSTGALEGQFAKKYSRLVEFSEQQLVDCSQEYGNEGCNGGIMDAAFNYTRDYGIEDENSYPYTAKDGDCKYNATQVVVNTTGYTFFTPGDEKELQAAVAKYGPISIGFDADLEFQLYGGGIFSSDVCDSVNLNHGMLIVGYGTSQGSDYWIVKNSWGIKWGEDGYVRVARNKNNMCGIATYTIVPSI